MKAPNNKEKMQKLNIIIFIKKKCYIIMIAEKMNSQKEKRENMNKIMEFMETKLAPTFSKLGANPYLLGIKNGMIATVPFTIFGSIFLIISQFPNDAWQAIVEPYKAMLNVPNLMTIGIIALYVAFSIGYNLAKEFKQDSLMGGIISFVGFMMLQIDAEYKIATTYFG